MDPESDCFLLEMKAENILTRRSRWAVLATEIEIVRVWDQIKDSRLWHMNLLLNICLLASSQGVSLYNKEVFACPGRLLKAYIYMIIFIICVEDSKFLYKNVLSRFLIRFTVGINLSIGSHLDSLVSFRKRE